MLHAFSQKTVHFVLVKNVRQSVISNTDKNNLPVFRTVSYISLYAYSELRNKQAQDGAHQSFLQSTTKVLPMPVLTTGEKNRGLATISSTA